MNTKGSNYQLYYIVSLFSVVRNVIEGLKTKEEYSSIITIYHLALQNKTMDLFFQV